MKNLTLENLEKVCGGKYFGSAGARNAEVTAITTDSRKVEKGCLFVPIVGERVDAHKFIPDVMRKGALSVLSEKTLEYADFPYILVKSTLPGGEGYCGVLSGAAWNSGSGDYRKRWKDQHKGSNRSRTEGKKYRTLKTQGNFNNELGLPLTVFRLRDEDEIAVLEMGISEFGEMTRLSRVARPNTCVITNIGTCHLENLGIGKAY